MACCTAIKDFTQQHNTPFATASNGRVQNARTPPRHPPPSAAPCRALTGQIKLNPVSSFITHSLVARSVGRMHWCSFRGAEPSRQGRSTGTRMGNLGKRGEAREEEEKRGLLRANAQIAICIMCNAIPCCDTVAFLLLLLLVVCGKKYKLLGAN